jgi:O-antigen/teichoic acid export membrane protein
MRTLASIVTFGRLAVFIAEMAMVLVVPAVLHAGPTLYWLFIYSFLSLLAYAINTDWVFRGLEKMEYVALWEALPRAIWLVGTLLFVRSPEDLLKVPLLRLAGELVTAGLLVAVAWRRYPNSRPSFALLHPLNIKLVVQEAAPIGLAALLAQVYYNFDTILLGFLKTDAVVGQYSAAYRIVTLLMTGAFLLAATYQPVLARCFATDRTGFSQHLRGLTAGSLLLGIVPAAPLAILMGSMPLAYLGIAYTTALIAAGKQRQMMIATAIGAGSNILANFILIPTLGMTGAAIATILSYAIACAAQWRYVRRMDGNQVPGI